MQLIRRIAAFAVMFMLVFAMAPAFAQSAQAPHTVIAGDTLYDLSKVYKGNPTLWRLFLEDNKFLDTPERMFERNGRWIVIIKPGETLNTQYLDAANHDLTRVPTGEVREIVAESTATKSFDWMLWLVVILITAAFLISRFALKRRECEHEARLANPITSGPPVVPGGIPPNRPAEIAERFRQIGLAHHVETHPTTSAVSTAMFTVVGAVEPMRFYGPMEIEYAYGRREMKRFSGERGYRANVRFPDGRIETLRFAEQCANDVRRGTRHIPGEGFREEPDTERQPIAVPEPDRSPVQVPLPAVAEAPTQVTLELHGFTFKVPAGSYVTPGTEGLTLQLHRAGTVNIVRIQKPQVVRKTTRSVAASGTEGGGTPSA